MSVRRSARANKGVHSGHADVVSWSNNYNDNNDDNQNFNRQIQPFYVPIPNESVRCLVCNTTDDNYDEDNDPNGAMVECDKCQTWQHVKCMFGKDAEEDDVPDDYLCDVCLPEKYQHLKKKISYRKYLKDRGITIADEYNDNDNDEEDYNDKNVDRDDYDDVVKEHMVNGKVEPLKRKLVTRQQPQQQLKKIKTSLTTSSSSSSSGSRSKSKSKSNNNSIITLRPKIVNNFKIKLQELIPKDVNNEILNGNSIDELSLKWAKILEDGLFNKYPNNYIERSRMLLLNLKISKLVERVINGEFKIEELPNLSKDDMLTKEMKEQADLVKRDAINKVVIKQDVQPIIKHTHKGEEIIGDSEFQFDINDKREKEVENMKEEVNNDERDDIQTINDYSVEDYDKDDNKINYNNENYESDDNDDNDNDKENEIRELSDEEFENIINIKPIENVKPLIEEKKIKKVKKSVTINDKPIIFHYTPEEEEEIKELPSTNDIWKGIIKTNDQQYECSLDFISSTCKNDKHIVIDRSLRIINEFSNNSKGEFMTIGRLNRDVAEKYLDKITISRDLYLYEVKFNKEDLINGNKFLEMWKYYYNNFKFGVIKNHLKFVKDCYLLSLSREKMIDADEFSIILNKFNRDEIFQNLDLEIDEYDNGNEINKFNDLKMYLVFVVQRDMDDVVSSNKRLNTKKREDKNKSYKEKVVESRTTISSTGNNNNSIPLPAPDDDYDPALSITLSKLTNSSNQQEDSSNDNKQSPDMLLEGLLKNIG